MVPWGNHGLDTRDNTTIIVKLTITMIKDKSAIYTKMNSMNTFTKYLPWNNATMEFIGGVMELYKSIGDSGEL